MTDKWTWKVLMVPTCLLLLFGLLGVFYPTPYMAFYLEEVADTSIGALSTTSPGIALLLETMFRAHGLGMTMSGILGISIILFAFRKGERWSIPALAIAGGVGLIGEIILEIVVLWGSLL
ncbi:MAG: hypothetical protein PF636_02335 [Actinomycetota bacterium]|nr:hypothetical protein [Actinomycetota bacterium]